MKMGIFSRFVLLSMTLFILPGCPPKISKYENLASFQNDPASNRYEAPPGKSRIYIMQPYRRGGFHPPAIYYAMDKKCVGMLVSQKKYVKKSDLGPGSFLVVDAVPGTHEITPLAGGKYPILKDPVLQLETKPDGVYFVQSVPKLWGLNGDLMGYQVQTVDFEKGRQLVGEYTPYNAFKPPMFQEKPIVQEKPAMVHIIRPYACHLGKGNMYFIIDRDVTASVSRCFHTSHSVTPGNHRIIAAGGAGGGDPLHFNGPNSTQVYAEPGQEIYLSARWKARARGVIFEPIDKATFETFKVDCKDRGYYSSTQEK